MWIYFQGQDLFWSNRIFLWIELEIRIFKFEIKKIGSKRIEEVNVSVIKADDQNEEE